MSKCGDNCGGCSSCFDGVTIPVGPKGDQGVPGPKGDIGATGATGSEGPQGNGIASNVWTSNSGGQPQGTQGTTDTYTITYTDGSTSTWEVYNGADGGKGDTGDTGATGSTGAPGPAGVAGATGPAGADGSKVYFTTGVPAPGLGADGDVAYDQTTTYPQVDIYQKITSTWQKQGTFGNVVNPGTPTPGPQSFLFKANKTSDQYLDAAATDMTVFFEDDTTSPTYFDNGAVWSSFDFTSDQSVAAIIFAVEGLRLANSTGGDITVDVRIEHEVPPAAPTTKVTTAVVVPLSGNIIMPLLKTSGFHVDAGDKVRVIATPQTGNAGDIKITEGEFYNYE